MLFIINSLLLGIGLAMDAFSVSAANGMANSRMMLYEKFRIAGTFAFFQFVMPMLGWIAVHGFLLYFDAFRPFIPWIAFLLLLFLGVKMILESFDVKDGTAPADGALKGLKKRTLFVQGVATSIDALSVGFTISDYDLKSALAASGIIAIVTLVICLTGVTLGTVIGNRITSKATMLGGIVLIIIGLEIFIRGVFL